MADTKITALSALTAADPANDVLPIVDVNDPFMAASGTTKKISINNILGASGTATLASATITGALTVDTTTLVVNPAGYPDRVGIGTATPAVTLDISDPSSVIRATSSTGTNTSFAAFANTGGAVRVGAENSAGGGLFTGSSAYSAVFGTTGAYSAHIGTNSSVRYSIASDGVATWSNVGGSSGTAMTLNSTGLGVGGAPVNPLTVFAAASAKAPALLLSTAGSPTYGWDFSVDGAVNGNLFIRSLVGGTKTDVLEFDRATGNLGIGVTPSYKLHVNGRVSYSTGIGEGADLTLSSTGTQVQHGISSTWTSQNFYTGGTSRVVMKQNGQVRFVPLAADPAGAEAGDVYYNSTSNKLKCYNGTTWNDLF